MLDSELLRKIFHEEPLSVADEAELDLLLAESKSAGQVVGALPEEVPSLAWRSELNARLIALAPVARRPRLAWWKIAAPVGVAGALAFGWVVMRSPAPSLNLPTVSNGATEAVIVQAHLESATQLDLTGNALAPVSGSEAEPTQEMTEWNSSDLESL